MHANKILSDNQLGSVEVNLRPLFALPAGKATVHEEFKLTNTTQGQVTLELVYLTIEADSTADL